MGLLEGGIPKSRSSWWSLKIIDVHCTVHLVICFYNRNNSNRIVTVETEKTTMDLWHDGIKHLSCNSWMKPENNSLFILKHVHSRPSTARELGNPWMRDKILSWRQPRAVCSSVQTHRAGKGDAVKEGRKPQKCKLHFYWRKANQLKSLYYSNSLIMPFIRNVEWARKGETLPPTPPPPS